MDQGQREQQKDRMRIAAAQITPVLLHREATLARVVDAIHQAADQGASLVGFSEGLVPGYPFWLSWTDGARFESPLQKSLHARYLDQAVVIEAGHLADVCAAAKARGIAVVLGIIERAPDRGGHSLFASMVTILGDGEVASVHRKLVPTYEERLSWAPGDGHGLRVHALGPFTLGSLNCWENWMPLARAALHAQGEDLHVASWPGSIRNTEDITRFVAKEGRSFVLSASSVLRCEDLPQDLPAEVLEAAPEVLADGGSAIAGPDGTWLLEPVVGKTGVFSVEIDHAAVREARQNLDVSGHYSRPDVLRLMLDDRRAAIIERPED